MNVDDMPNVWTDAKIQMTWVWIYSRILQFCACFHRHGVARQTMVTPVHKGGTMETKQRTSQRLRQWHKNTNENGNILQTKKHNNNRNW